nr:PEPxxWA-CTERM sorting domain-containing protein [Sphingomonas azotifigens]
MKKAIFAVTTIAAMLCAVPANAALVNLNYKLSYSSGFQYQSNTPVLSGLVADFDVAFDDSADIAPTSSGLTIHMLNLGWTKPVTFAYNAYLKKIMLSTNPGATWGHNDNPAVNGFGVFLRTDQPETTVYAAYSNGSGMSYEGTLGVLRTELQTSAVPEPITWAMMLVGFGTVGAAVRYRRRKVAIAY